MELAHQAQDQESIFMVIVLISELQCLQDYWSNVHLVSVGDKQELRRHAWEFQTMIMKILCFSLKVTFVNLDYENLGGKKWNVCFFAVIYASDLTNQECVITTNTSTLMEYVSTDYCILGGKFILLSDDYPCRDYLFQCLPATPTNISGIDRCLKHVKNSRIRKNI